MPKVTQKGQVTIPVEIRKLLGLKPSDEVDFVIVNDNVIIKKKIGKNPFVKYQGVLKERLKKSTDEIINDLRGEVE